MYHMLDESIKTKLTSSISANKLCFVSFVQFLSLAKLRGIIHICIPFSLSAVETSKHYIQSVVYGKDLVIRSGIRQLLKMRVDMITLLRKSDKPKYQIIFGNPCKATQDRHSLFGKENVSC